MGSAGAVLAEATAVWGHAGGAGGAEEAVHGHPCDCAHPDQEGVQLGPEEGPPARGPGMRMSAVHAFQAMPPCVVIGLTKAGRCRRLGQADAEIGAFSCAAAYQVVRLIPPERLGCAR